MESKSQWYYENQGKAEGPISTLELVHKIREGELSLLDLIFKEGEGQWMPAEHFPEIKNLIKTTATQFKADSDWIVLRTVEVDGRDHFEQIGPFTIEQVLQLLDKGRIKFTDFVWRNGYENWVPLGHVDQFENPLESSVQVDLSIYEKPRQDDLNAKTALTKNYKPAEKIRTSPQPEAKPPEAKGEDLARAKWEIAPPAKTEAVKEPEVKKERRKSVVEAPAKTETVTEETENTDHREQRAVARGRWQAVASLLVIVSFCTGAGLFFIYGQKVYRSFQKRPSEITFEPIAATKPPPVAAVAPKPTAVSQVSASSIAQASPIEKRSAPAQESVVSSPSTGSVSPMEKVSEPKVVKFADLDFSQMTAKQKSYFLNKERLFLFYQAQKGTRLVADIYKIINKPDKKRKSLKDKVDSWLKQAQSLSSQVRMEAKDPHVYPDFFKRLVAATQQLDERGREIQSQLVNGRGPSKELTLKEIESEFKKIMNQARDLD